jgi:hypothetical protein
MIEFSDRTLIEADGSYDAVKELMRIDGGIEWMLRSETIVDAGPVMARYLLHFWWDGRVIIMETDHPPIMEVPEDDIIELRDWCKDKGWSLQVHKDLVANPTGFTFWLRLFRAGVVYSEVLVVHEKEEIDRFKKAFTKLEEED